jgi:hypothetical protein
VTEVRFFNERGRDRFEEYLDIKRRRPAQAAAIRDAITLVVADPDRAEHDYSIGLGDPQARYFGIEIVHFQQAWGDDLDRPKVWPRD